MSDTTAEPTTTEPKPPTIAEIVREKTDDGARIIDFFLDVMEGRVEGAELCHRMDAAKELVKFGSAKAVIFIAKYKGIPCGHSTRRRRDSADSCIAEERSLVEVTLNAPASLTREFLTVLSGIDEFLMRRLIRAQTGDGGTIIDFLDDVMQDRNEGFKTHHRIAAAKELIVHILRDEQPSHTPSPSTTPSPTPAVGADPRVRPLPGSETPSPSTGEGREPALSLSKGEGDSIVVPTQPDGNPDSSPVVPAEAGTHPSDPVLSTPEGSAHLEPVEGPEAAEGKSASAHPEPREIVVPAHTTVVPAQSLPRTRYGAGTHPVPLPSAHPEPVEGPAGSSSVVPATDPAEGRQDDKARRPRRRRTRTQRRRDGNARAAIRRKALGSERIEKEKDEQHWHEPDPYGAPIDSTHPGRSPPS